MLCQLCAKVWGFLKKVAVVVGEDDDDEERLEERKDCCVQLRQNPKRLPQNWIGLMWD